MAITAYAAVNKPSYQIRDVNGAVRHPLDAGGNKAVVFIFIANDCPISNSYAPEINRLATAYTRQNIAFYLVNVDQSVPAAIIKEHARAYGYHCPVLLDNTHSLAKIVGATVTPEAAVLAPNGKVLYRGRIDNRYADYGVTRATATTHDLRQALDAILKGQPLLHPITKAIGCFI